MSSNFRQTGNCLLRVLFVVLLLVLGVRGKTAIYRGSVYRGVTEKDINDGGQTFSVQLSVPAFPGQNRSEAIKIMTDILSSNVRLIDDEGKILNSSVSWMGRNSPLSESSKLPYFPALRDFIESLLNISSVSVEDEGRRAVVVLAKLDTPWRLPNSTSLLVVPCLPLALFVGLTQIGVEDMPLNCLAGDPFLVHRNIFATLDHDRWAEKRKFFVTANAVEVPLRGSGTRSLDKFSMEHNLRVMEGVTCLHTRPAYVRGSSWDIHEQVYRFTPHRGGVQSLCYTPYPDLPLLRIKLMDSYEVAGPEGVSTDPPQVRAELEFTGTIYGTNLTERDTAVITDELCTDFTSQNVFFVELFFSSASRVSFFGTFHKRGIYHVCYHREGSSSYVRVSTLVVERGTEVVIESDSASVLIDQDVKLLQSASVTRLKVQNKGNLDLKKRSLNVSYFIWSGGSISGKGLINCTGYSKITTQGYETRQLLVPIYNYGEMTIGVQRLSIEQEGAIHNYGNLTIAVASMGEDGISSILSQGKKNAIYNYATSGFLRIVAIDTRSYVLLTNRFVLVEGPTMVIGKVNLTDVSNGIKSIFVVRPGSYVSVNNAHLGGTIHISDDSTLAIGDGGVLVSAYVSGLGALVVSGDGTLLDSTTVVGGVKVQFGSEKGPSIHITAYGTNTFGTQTYVHVVNTFFVTGTGVAKMLISGVFTACFENSGFRGSVVIQVDKIAVSYGNSSRLSAQSIREKNSQSSMASLLTPPDSVFYVIDTSNDTALEAESASAPHCRRFIEVTEYLSMNGRVMIRGCVSIPMGGSLNKGVSALTKEEDWAFLLKTVCHEEAVFLPNFCQLQKMPPPLFSGLSIGSDVYIRGAAVFEVDNFTLHSATLRATEPVFLKSTNDVVIDKDSSLSFIDTVKVFAENMLVLGSMQVGSPASTLIQGKVRVEKDGALSIAGGRNCEQKVDIKGGLTVAEGGSVLCTEEFHKGGEHTGQAESATDFNLLGGLPPDTPCPANILEDIEKRKRFFLLYFVKEDYVMSNEYPKTKEMIVATVCAIVLTSVIFFIFLHLWGFSFYQWYDDFRMKPPLKLTLTWYELSYSTLNYVGFCSITVMHVQNTMSAFHPAFPAPLPLVGVLCMRSLNVLMPHHVISALQTNMVSIVYLSCSVISVILGQQPHVKKRGGDTRSNAKRLFLEALDSCVTILLVPFMLFHTPITSLILDGVACSTVLRDVPSCKQFSNKTTFVLSFASLISASVFVPWSIVSQQMRITRLDLRLKVSWLFLMHCVELLDITMWKIFYNSPLKLVFSNIFFHTVSRVVCHYSPPTAYENINRFLYHVSLLPLLTYIGVLVQHIRVQYGLISDCTDGELMFKLIFAVGAITLFVSFWNNVLYARAPNDSVGDANIDAIRRAVTHIRSRIADLKMEVFSTTDPIDRENTLNAIARLRIEFLEKQERYRYETHRVMQPFYLGKKFAIKETPKNGRGSASFFDSDNFTSTLLSPSSTVSQSPNLLTVEEMETFSCGPALGKGSYGTVHLGILSNGRLVAVKYVNIVNESHEVLDSVKAEVDVLKQLSHPNIIRYYGAHLIEDTMLVFMEFAVGGSLTSILRKFSELTEPVMQLYTYQILRGLRYLHDKGVVHRDIKGENILIDGFGVAKLADFGCSKSLANIANGSHLGCGTLVGSPFWMAPEVIRSEAYGTKADIWSVGCTVVEMLNRGEPPWREEFDNVYSAMFYVGSTNDIPQIPEKTSDLCRGFLHRCFERDVAKRATADELLSHPWLGSALALKRDDSISDVTSELPSLSYSPSTHGMRSTDRRDTTSTMEQRQVSTTAASLSSADSR